MWVGRGRSLCWKGLDYVLYTGHPPQDFSARCLLSAYPQERWELSCPAAPWIHSTLGENPLALNSRGPSQRPFLFVSSFSMSLTVPRLGERRCSGLEVPCAHLSAGLEGGRGWVMVFSYPWAVCYNFMQAFWFIIRVCSINFWILTLARSGCCALPLLRGSSVVRLSEERGCFCLFLKVWLRSLASSSMQHALFFGKHPWTSPTAERIRLNRHTP